MRGADLLVATLAAAGVGRIFSLSGNQIMPVYDACIDAGIDIVHTRHEAAAVFMADAHHQLTGEIGVALVTAAPGAANALGPLFTARQSESAVLFLTGDSPRIQDGRGAFQELDQVSMTAPLVKHAWRAETAGALGGDVARAMQIALSGRPGPVHVALPFDVVEGDAGDRPVVPEAKASKPAETAVADDVLKVVETLAAADKPLVLCGPVVSETRAGALLDGLAEAADASVLAMESPRGLRDPSLGGLAKVVGRADLIVCLGKPVNFTLGFGTAASKTCRWIVVDPEPAELERARLNLGGELELALLGATRPAIEAMTAAASGGDRRAAWRQHVAELIAARSHPTTEPKRITSAVLCAAVQRHIEAAAESVVISDGGEFGQWAQATTRGTHRIINGPSGAIGGALCYAIAAAKAKPDATVVAFMGDGTVGFHLAEFETAVRERTPIIVIVGNDGCWNAERQIQLRDYGPDRLIGCDLSAARYDLAVEGLGGHGEYVTEWRQLDAALQRAFAAGKPACVNVEIEGLPAPDAGSEVERDE